MNGWIKLHRKIMRNEKWDNDKMLKVFIWCLLKATHEAREQLVGMQKVNLLPGQFVTGREAGARELQMAQSSFRRLLDRLKQLQFVDIKTTNKFSVVTVVNWAFYQCDGEDATSKPPTPEQQMNNKWTTDEQQMDTNKNTKNIKNTKKDKKYLDIAKTSYAEHVSMTEEQCQKLIEKHGPVAVADMIDRLNNYKISTGQLNKYKCDYHTLLNWFRREDERSAVKSVSSGARKGSREREEATGKAPRSRNLDHLLWNGGKV